jgi:hypothetical protein
MCLAEKVKLGIFGERGSNVGFAEITVKQRRWFGASWPILRWTLKSGYERGGKISSPNAKTR